MKIAAIKPNYEVNKKNNNSQRSVKFCGQVEWKEKNKTKTYVPAALGGLVLTGLAIGFRKNLAECFHGIKKIKTKYIQKTTPTEAVNAFVKSNLTGSVGLTKRTGSCL